MLTLLREFDAEFITAVFFTNEYRNNNLISINSGRCYDWAYYAVRTFSHLPIELYSTESHAYVKYEDRYYDSEAPRGVEKWNRLRTNAWWSGYHRRMDLEGFKKLWDSIGAGKRYHWDSELEENMKRILGRYYRPIKE